MGRSLNLDVIAEGVETPIQADFLRALGCNKVQGFLYGKPMESGDLELLIKRSAFSPRTNSSLERAHT